MKISCELCGGALQMNVGGQGATCGVCGLAYPIERLREMLAARTAVKTEAPKPVEQNPVVKAPVAHGVNTPAAVSQPPINQQPRPSAEGKIKTSEKPQRRFSYQPEQFIMNCEGYGYGYVKGFVTQGCIGVGEKVYLNGFYKYPYRVYQINEDYKDTELRMSMTGELFLDDCPENKHLQNVHTVTGAVNPVANAYNYPGGVKKYFEALFADAFSDYEIWKNSYNFQWGGNVDYLFCKNSVPVLAVLLADSVCGRNKVKKMLSRIAAADDGVPCVHFYEDYRNDAPYVIDRICKALGE